MAQCVLNNIHLGKTNDNTGEEEKLWREGEGEGEDTDKNQDYEHSEGRKEDSITAVLEEDEEKQSRKKKDQGVLAATRPVHQKKRNVGKYYVYVFGQH
jgi:hypothetical protein